MKLKNEAETSIWTKASGCLKFQVLKISVIISYWWGHMFLSPGSWCPRRNWFPSLWKFYHQIPLAFKIIFPGSSQSLCQIPRLENLLGALELLQQYKNVFGIIFLQFVSYLFTGSTVELMVTSSKRMYATCWISQVCWRKSPIFVAGHCWHVPPQETLTQRQVRLSVLLRSLLPFRGSWCTWGFVCIHWVSLVGMRFDFKHYWATPTNLLGSYWGPLPLDVGCISLVGSNILLLMVVQQLIATLVFSHEKMNVHISILPSCVMNRSSLHNE